MGFCRNGRGKGVRFARGSAASLLKTRKSEGITTQGHPGKEAPWDLEVFH